MRCVSSDVREVPLWRVAATAAALVLAGCTSNPHLGPGLPTPPRAIVTLTIDRNTYTTNMYGRVATRHPLALASNKPVSIVVGMRAPSGARISDVWLTLTAARGGSGIGRGRPIGRYKLLAHHPGVLTSAQRLTATWTAERLFNTSHLTLNVTSAIGDSSTSSPIEMFDIRS